MRKNSLEYRLLGLDKIRADSKKLAESLSREVAHYAAEELYKKAQEVLQIYYDDYDPIEYSRYNGGERTFQLRNKSAHKIYDNSNRVCCKGGVEINSDDLYYPNKGADPTKTVDSFLDGWHGGWCEMQGGYVPRIRMENYGKSLLKKICGTKTGDELIDKAIISANLTILKRG